MSAKHQFENQFEEYYDEVLFYGLNNYESRILSGNLGGSVEWETLFDNEISFEFKAGDYQNSDNKPTGFYLFLTCK